MMTAQNISGDKKRDQNYSRKKLSFLHYDMIMPLCTAKASPQQKNIIQVAQRSRTKRPQFCTEGAGRTEVKQHSNRTITRLRLLASVTFPSQCVRLTPQLPVNWS